MILCVPNKHLINFINYKIDINFLIDESLDKLVLSPY